MPPPKPDWYGGADYYLAVWDEYERVGAAWTYRRRLAYPDYIQPYSPILEAVIHISGFNSGKRYRPQYWNMELNFGQHRSRYLFDDRLKGSCKSVSDALRQADAILADDAWTMRMLKAAYARTNHNITALYRLKEGLPKTPSKYGGYPTHSEEVLNDPDNWEPWGTDLATGWDHYWLPTGFYLSIRPTGEVTRFDRSTWGSGGCCMGKDSETAKRLTEKLTFWCN